MQLSRKMQLRLRSESPASQPLEFWLAAGFENCEVSRGLWKLELSQIIRVVRDFWPSSRAEVGAGQKQRVEH